MRLLFFCFFSIYQITALAGDTKGHGGDILVCENQTNDYHYFSLDNYELHEKFNLTLDIPEFTNEYNLAKLVIERLQFYDFHRMDSMLSNLKTFEKDIKWVNFPLVNVRDTGKVELPESCELKQIINQNKRLLRGNKKYLIRKDLWKKIKTIDKAMLIVHELLYLESKTFTSQGIRQLTSYMYSNSLTSFSQREYWDFLISNKFNSLSFNGFNFKINKNLEFYNNTIISAIPKEDSMYTLNLAELSLYESPVLFYPNGNLKELCFYGEYSFIYQGQTLKAYCVHTFGYYEPIRFHENLNIQRIPIIGSEFNYKGLNFGLGDINESNTLFSTLHFAENGELVKIENSKLVLNFNLTKIHFSANNPFLIENTTVIGLIAKRQKVSSSNNQFYIVGKSIIQKSNLFKTQMATPTYLELAGNTFFIEQNTPISFYPTGEINSVVLGEDQEVKLINGTKKMMPKGSLIFFNKEGNLL